jgi:glycosyltransferase involved in cell wall biosynthesis
MDKISVCMATYNGAEFILEQLRSILGQLTPEDEVIISDDSSRDGTVELICSLNDPRIRVLGEQQFHSPIYNFENAIKAATGNYIILADQDDVWLPGRVANCVTYLKNGYDLVLNDCKIVDKDLKVLHDSFFSVNRSRKGLIVNILKNSYLGCCLAFRRDVLRMILPFPKNIPMHDIWIGFVAETVGRSKFLDQQLVLYRRHGRNESSSGEQSPFGIARRFLFRWNTLKYLPLVLFRKYKYRKL